MPWTAPGLAAFTELWQELGPGSTALYQPVSCIYQWFGVFKHGWLAWCTESILPAVFALLFWVCCGHQRSFVCGKASFREEVAHMRHALKHLHVHRHVVGELLAPRCWASPQRH